MNEEFKYNILVTGLFFSGSSAVTDLLREYNSVGVIPGEFDSFRRKGLVGDHIEGRIGKNYECQIDKHIRCLKYNTRTYIPFYCNEQVKKISFIRYLISRTPIKHLYKGGLLKNITKKITILAKLKDDISNAKTQEDKIKIAKNWLKITSDQYSYNKTHILYDQPIFYNSHQKIWPKVFDPYKLIVVYRDPRDQIADLIKRNLIFFDIETPTRGLLDIYGDNRLGAIRYELDTLQARFNNAKKLQKTLGKDKVLFISFESLINNYDIEKEKIENFLLLKSESHIYNNKFFKPRTSSKNIGIYKNHLTNEELKLFKSVELSFDD